jgi:hypothetical protein
MPHEVDIFATKKLKPMRYLLVVCIFWVVENVALAQRLSGISTHWDNAFGEWDLYALSPDADSTELADGTAPEEQIGELRLRWLDVKDDWTEWDFSVNGRTGIIKIKWKNDPSLWELRTFDGQVVTMKTIWAGDYSAWRVSDGTHTFDYQSRYRSQADEWSATDANLGRFWVYSQVEGDPRDWLVQDDWGDQVPVTTRLAMLFLTIFYTSPKE